MIAHCCCRKLVAVFYWHMLSARRLKDLAAYNNAWWLNPLASQTDDVVYSCIIAVSSRQETAMVHWFGLVWIFAKHAEV